MKTSVTLTRKIGDFEVFQRTSDGMFNATALLRQWNSNTGMKKDVKDFFYNQQTNDFLEVLIKEENLHGGNSPYVKSKASRGVNSGTWMHPFLFIRFAMWLNPRFEYQVIKFVHDELIKDRHLAGDNYVLLCKSLSVFPETDYSQIGTIINLVVFNKHEPKLRDKATPEQERDIQQLERDAIRYIELGFIKSFEQFKDVMRKEWAFRHCKPLSVSN